MRTRFSPPTIRAIAVALVLGCALPVANAPAGTLDVQQPRFERQLDQVRIATAKYLDVNQAVADGYMDIHVFVPGQGNHYLNPNLLDANFELDKPELLFYAANPDGDGLRLVAVEYAVPLDLATKAPKGFVGRHDVWDQNQDFQLWTLHAWVWLWNPDGVFAETNAYVP